MDSAVVRSDPPPVAREPRDAVGVLSVRGLCKAFEARRLIDGADLDIGPGQTVALMGESGAGKSTLLNMIAGLEPVDAGEIRLLGRPVPQAGADASAEMRRRHIGFVFQAFHLIAYLPVWQNVAVPLMLLGVARDEARGRARQGLARLGLLDRADALSRDLSGGEQQRVAIARALIHRPALVLADEPTGNLDPSSAARVLDTLCTTVAESGAALLMVTHSTRAAAAMGRTVLLREGRLVDSVSGPAP